MVTIPPLAANSAADLTIPNIRVVLTPLMAAGHITYADTHGRFFTKCLDPDCRNPDCVIPDVMES